MFDIMVLVEVGKIRSPFVLTVGDIQCLHAIAV